MRQGNTATRTRAAGYLLSVAVAVGAAVVGVAGCEVPQTIALGGQMGAVEAYVGELETMASVLGTVVDDESARAAAPQIRAIAREIAAIRRRMGQLSAVDRDVVVDLYGSRLATASESLRRETLRIGARQGLVEEVQEALASVPPLG